MDQTNVEALAAQQYPQCHHRVALVVGDDHTDALARTKRRAIRRRSEQGQMADDGFPQLTVSSTRLTGGLGGRPFSCGTTLSIASRWESFPEQRCCSSR